jgi:hypothetical protein
MAINSLLSIRTGKHLTIIPGRDKSLTLKPGQMGLQFIQEPFIGMGIATKDFKWRKGLRHGFVSSIPFNDP